ncbi:hypothetical protein Q5H89_00635 [Hymenobacter sp. CA2-7]|uniref:DUF7003 family protein n=1 Tax=Hymenobacter sp. CA2-7 TaxID=3063993 RepID=UPI002713E562|nr:hypothetical protein [Hymenobacter sp. CA2-7]MDO7883849.1 hypothetical protein [Hymenobacter sp. CA2-7]
MNLEEYNNRQTNYYALDVIDWASWQAATKDELLDPAAETILVRNTPVRLTHDKAAYAQAGIELVAYEPDRITPDEIGRLLVLTHAPLFRATDAELHKSIPANLEKILVLDEWYHKDFVDSPVVELSPGQLTDTYELNKANLAPQGISQGDLASLIAAQNQRMMQQNLEAWEQHRPSSYETWPQLAQVLATGDVSYYRPTLPPNTHWRNWPESGSL